MAKREKADRFFSYQYNKGMLLVDFEKVDFIEGYTFEDIDYKSVDRAYDKLTNKEKDKTLKSSLYDEHTITKYGMTIIINGVKRSFSNTNKEAMQKSINEVQDAWENYTNHKLRLEQKKG